MTDQEVDDLLDEAPDSEIEQLEEQVVDEATAARTVAELETEIQHLRVLEEQAKKVRYSNLDKKWEELSRLLQDTPEMYSAEGRRRKLIIFTEHKDTLNYLTDRIRTLLGSEDAVVLIHGGVHREERRKVQERFTQDKKTLILVATDAAGEGINLQRANLLINYDLPWNPNRMEQRFGRIHRIGQAEVCHMWNMVADETREGDVFRRLFEKLELEREALGGRVFDILGEAFREVSLKQLLIDAIRYGDDPEVKARLHRQVEGPLDTDRLKAIIQRNALATETMSLGRLYAVKEEMEKAQARKLQPFFIKSFFNAAFETLGGQIRQREPGRFEISYVPAAIRQRDRIIGAGAPILKSYERICFEKERITQEGKPLASLICPGHPLMDSIIDLVLEQHRELLRRGAVLIDPADEGVESRVLFLVDHQIRDAGLEKSGRERVISQRMQFVQVDRTGQVMQGGYAPYLDFRPATEDEVKLLADALRESWLHQNLSHLALAHAVATLVPGHLSEVRYRREVLVTKTLHAVNERLIKEINYWSHRALQLEMEVRAGRQPRMQPENARRTAEDLTSRLQQRTKELEEQRHVVSGTPHVVGGALVIPQGLLSLSTGDQIPDWTPDAAMRAKVERIAMKAVIDAERLLGHTPDDVSASKYGWDVTSHTGSGELRLIEVKGRVKGAGTVTVTKNEIITCLNQPERFILALVLVDGDAVEGPYYLLRPFTQELDFSVTSINLDLKELLKAATRIGPGT